MSLHPTFAFQTPSREDIVTASEATLEKPSKTFRQILDGVWILVDDLAEDNNAKAVGLEIPWNPLGFHRGIPFRQATRRGTQAPDAILLHRLPILPTWTKGRNSPGHVV